MSLWRFTRKIYVITIVKEENNMATALKGCVIVEDNNGRVAIRHKCENCGYIEPGTSSFGLDSGTVSSRATCSKCGKVYDVVVQASR